MLWFLNTLVSFPASHDDGDDGLSVMESLAPRGDSPPYHIHHTEDECFHVLEGELVLLEDGKTRRLSPGQTYLARKGLPHTYRVVSERSRWLVITTQGDLERFVREWSRPAEAVELPPPAHPSPEQQAQLAEVCLRHGIELVGPPLAEDVADAA